MKHPLIRTIYLYLFALVGLALITAGTVKLANLGLKMFIFTKADEQVDYYRRPPVIAVYPGGKELSEDDFVSAVEKCKEKCELSDDQKQQIADWLKDYKNWQEQPKIDYKTQQRQRDAAQSLAFLLVGVPLYLFHWGIIRNELKESKG